MLALLVQAAPLLNILLIAFPIAFGIRMVLKIDGDDGMTRGHKILVGRHHEQIETPGYSYVIEERVILVYQSPWWDASISQEEEEKVALEVPGVYYDDASTRYEDIDRNMQGDFDEQVT